MRLTKIALALSAMLFLSACSGTWNGMKADAKDLDNWSEGKPSAMGNSWGAFPRGYYGQNLGKPVLHPPAQTADATPPKAEWKQVDNFDQNGMAAAPAGDSMGNLNNDAVTVYPVDGPAYTADNLPPVEDYGQLVQELFFGYGSSAISVKDSKKLASFAKGIAHGQGGMNGMVHVTVVGHASKIVKGVKDPVRRKEINFEMAQKRANAVTRVLKKSGLKPAWVEAVSRGADDPNPAPGGKPQAAADQRVDVYMK
jgi:outer membrane protein OmpA-like peptidoglycan-associated protein